MLHLLGVLLIASTGLYALLVIVLYAWQDRLLFQPVPDVHLTPDDAGLPYEAVTITTADAERLHAWWVPAAEERAVVLFFHGNAGNLSGRLGTLDGLRRLGLSTLAIDYRGYGHSTGRPSEDGLYQDAEAAWHYLTETRGVDATQIIVFARSLGSGPAAWLAVQHPPAALVLEAAFTSVPDVAADHYPMLPTRRLVRTHFPNAEHLARLQHPLLIIHSRDDEVIPFKHGLRLHEAAAGPKRFIATHGPHGAALFEDPTRFANAFEQLLEEAILVDGPREQP